ncbi:MAG: cation-transporting P-type ATPase [Desulfuromonadales bacterium]
MTEPEPEKSTPRQRRESSPADLPDRPWSQSADKVLSSLDVDPNEGLSEEQVQEYRKRYGPNRLKESRSRSAWKIFIDQFASLVVILLGVASIAALVFGKWMEGVAIGIALLLNAVIGFFTELRATRSMEALHRLGSAQARVLRSGKARSIAIDELVPGDVLPLEAGDVVPADLRIVEANNLQADESALTGESLPVAKQHDEVSEEAPLAERSCMLFKGTAITAGSGAGVATATGMGTELGTIATLAEEAEEEATPLEKRLERLGRRLVWATLAAGVLVAAAGLIAGKEWLLVLETAIAMAVAAVPEGLPVVATIALARGMRRMARRNALINRLSAVETLGATTVICTDKTGTLTENRMHLESLELASGTVEFGEEEKEKEEKKSRDLLRQALELGVLCNNASRDEQKGGGVGDPLEVALLDAGAKKDLDRAGLLEQFPEVREEAFSSETLMMATVHRTDSGFRVAVKGAPEAVLKVCTSLAGKEREGKFSDAERKRWMERNREMAAAGLRVLALAEKETSSPDDDPYSDLTLIGLAGLWDPPRKAVEESLENCRQAGIRVIMVTGDHPETAGAVAEAVGLNSDHVEARSGEELEEIDNVEEQDRRKLLETVIFARVDPKQKLSLIALHQEAGDIVAMTGDGINDAPALKKADIGVAMGQRGTQVAREAADMVLRDDDFSSIVNAVYHGRIIFGNIRKFIFFLLSGNVSEILIITLAALANAPLPLLPLQILYLNLIGDVFPALALGVGEGSRSVMKQPPRDPDEPILTRGYWLAIGGYAVVITAAVLGCFALALTHYGMDQAQAVTVAFLSLSLARLSHVFNMRDTDSKLIRNEVTSNPYIWAALAICLGLLAAAFYIPILRNVLGLVSPGAAGWWLILAGGVLPLLVGQVVKEIRKRTRV